MDNYNEPSRIVDGNFDGSLAFGLCIYALSEKLRPLLDLRVCVTGGVHFDLVKQVFRDIQHAGQKPEEIIQQISETSTKTVTVDQIKAVFSNEYKETTEETYDIYLLPRGEDPEACQSYLRMRNKDGKYTLMFEVTYKFLVYMLSISVSNSRATCHLILSFPDGSSGYRACWNIFKKSGPEVQDLTTLEFISLLPSLDKLLEWLTDSPFIISPRITFEVSVRLLGGLMALGYSIATILKRSSHFSDGKVETRH
ncbi:inorganic pyrophosphatase TTM1-like [Lycium barbarum]|uniref:inorganic pyrophosphatase TTM1-like n=1 Tax=Lycium barbarum TaxID=112863 RepID=UPI00293EFB79|nr:inorganic pyrophosphatase TTM1-like [Lycium barbarum]